MTGWYEVPYYDEDDEEVFHERIVGLDYVPRVFKAIRDEWDNTVTPARRTIHELEVLDATPVDMKPVPPPASPPSEADPLLVDSTDTRGQPPSST